MNDQKTLKIQHTEKPVQKTFTSMREIPVGEVFRLAKSGTPYIKTKTGAIVNVEKALRRQLKQRANTLRQLEALKQSIQEEATTNA